MARDDLDKKLNSRLKQRARSDLDKQSRKAMILSVARQALETNSYEQLTMAHLAKLAGLAKGTLYIYFDTKEELFLDLYNQVLEDWLDRFVRATNKSQSPSELPAILARISIETELFLPLITKLTAVLEQNVRGLRWSCCTHSRTKSTYGRAICLVHNSRPNGTLGLGNIPNQNFVILKRN